MSISINGVMQSISKFIMDEEIGKGVVDVLLPNGDPLSTETEMWDFKREFLGDETDQSKVKLKHHELLKDVVSFHNGYGGYILIGVDEKKENALVGTNETIDASKINDLVNAYTSGSFKCFAQVHRVQSKRIVLIHVPKRAPYIDPVKFKKVPSEFGSNKPYSVGDIYIRADDKCRPANKEISDWRLLLSDRSYGVDQVQRRLGRIKNNLPAPDPEIVRFVGRSEELADLRAWLSSEHYPTRMITGIGGLGKTALARQFVQEVVEFNYPNIEQVLWYSAKQKTFAALRGAVIEITRFDYTDTKTLFERMLVDFVGDGASDDAATISELQELLLDCLQMCPTLFVIDDIDSLTEEEQRVCVSEINSLILRTSGREHPPSRALITSRLDQGLSPTAVMKISGLDKDSFYEHIRNVSNQFQIPEIKRALVDEFFQVSSGSPLFAASMVRLVSLGEDPRTLADKWRGSLGEDIREFAFSRELETLSHHAAATLLAIIRLEKASISELSEVLMFPARRFNDLIGELQKFHLVSTVEHKGLVPTFSASNELTSVIAPLKEKLGSTSTAIESGCARIKKERNLGPKVLAHSIHDVIGLLKAGRPQDAYEKSKLILQSNKKNPDAHCLFARTALDAPNPDWDAVNKSVEFAMDNNCVRPELDRIYIDVKYSVDDWRSIMDYFSKKPSNIVFPRKNIIIYSQAILESSKIKYSAGRMRDAAELAIGGIRAISGKMYLLQGIELSSLNDNITALTSIYLKSKNVYGNSPSVILNAAYAYNELARSGNDKIRHAKSAVSSLARFVGTFKVSSQGNYDRVEKANQVYMKISTTLSNLKKIDAEFDKYGELDREMANVESLLRNYS